MGYQTTWIAFFGHSDADCIPRRKHGGFCRPNSNGARLRAASIFGAIVAMAGSETLAGRYLLTLVPSTLCGLATIDGFHFRTRIPFFDGYTPVPVIIFLSLISTIFAANEHCNIFLLLLLLPLLLPRFYFPATHSFASFPCSRSDHPRCPPVPASVLVPVPVPGLDLDSGVVCGTGN